jgi:hypothetical protein
MIYVTALSALICVCLALMYRGARRALTAERAKSAALSASVFQRDHVIDRMQEVYREAQDRKDAIAVGTPAARVDASISVLSDIARAGRSRAAQN